MENPGANIYKIWLGSREEQILSIYILCIYINSDIDFLIKSFVLLIVFSYLLLHYILLQFNLWPFPLDMPLIFFSLSRFNCAGAFSTRFSCDGAFFSNLAGSWDWLNERHAASWKSPNSAQQLHSQMEFHSMWNQPTGGFPSSSTLSPAKSFQQLFSTQKPATTKDSF